MKLIQQITMLCAILMPGISNAAVLMPQLEIGIIGDDAGANIIIDGAGATFSFDATATHIITDSSVIDITDQVFTLNASTAAFTDGANGGGYFDGSFSVGIGDGQLLAGTFSNLMVGYLSNGTTIKFNGDLTYTPGSGGLQGSLTGGAIDGSSVTATKLGAVTVVPVPAAAWLFGSGLLGLAGIARRKTA